MANYHMSCLCRDMVYVNLTVGKTNNDGSKAEVMTAFILLVPRASICVAASPRPHWFNDFRSWLSEHGLFLCLAFIFLAGFIALGRRLTASNVVGKMLLDR